MCGCKCGTLRLYFGNVYLCLLPLKEQSKKKYKQKLTGYAFLGKQRRATGSECYRYFTTSALFCVWQGVMRVCVCGLDTLHVG